MSAARRRGLALTVFLALPAGEPLDVRVSPSLFEEVLPPGRRVVRSIRLFNRAEKSVPVIAAVFDWSMDAEGRIVFGKPGSMPSSCANRITVIPERMVLPPGASASVAVVLQPLRPEGDPSTRWAAVLFRFPDADTTAESGEPVRITPRLSTTIYITPPEATSSPLRLGSLSAAPSDGSGLPDLHFEVSNEGATHARFTVRCELLDGFGAPEDALERPNQVVLPRSLRRYHLKGSRRLAAGVHTVLVRVDAPGMPAVTARTTLRVPSDP